MQVSLFTKKNYPQFSEIKRARLNFELQKLFEADSFEEFTDRDYKIELSFKRVKINHTEV